MGEFSIMTLITIITAKAFHFILIIFLFILEVVALTFIAHSLNNLYFVKRKCKYETTGVLDSFEIETVDDENLFIPVFRYDYKGDVLVNRLPEIILFKEDLQKYKLEEIYNIRVNEDDTRMIYVEEINDKESVMDLLTGSFLLVSSLLVSVVVILSI